MAGRILQAARRALIVTKRTANVVVVLPRSIRDGSSSSRHRLRLLPDPSAALVIERNGLARSHLKVERNCGESGGVLHVHVLRLRIRKNESPREAAKILEAHNE